MSEGRIILVTGSSGSGKTAWTIQRVAGHGRVLAWDPEGEFAARPGFVAVNEKQLVGLASKGAPGKYAFVPPSGSGDFHFWARCAWCYAQTPGEKTVIADETSDVTHTGKASGAWGQLIRRGRKYGCTVIGITQRPAESDKTIVGNASLIHICPQWEMNDCKYLSERFGVPVADIAGLISDKKRGLFEYIEIDRFERTTRKGSMQF